MTVAGGGTVGVRRIHAVATTKTAQLRIRVQGGGTLRAVRAFHTGFTTRPELEKQPAFMTDKMDERATH
jgi:alpha-L-fucosidase